MNQPTEHKIQAIALAQGLIYLLLLTSPMAIALWVPGLVTVVDYH